jgi:hypothetical protein
VCSADEVIGGGKVESMNFSSSNFAANSKMEEHSFCLVWVTQNAEPLTLRARTLVECSTGQKYIYTGSHDGYVYIYDVVTCSLSPSQLYSRLLVASTRS